VDGRNDFGALLRGSTGVSSVGQCQKSYRAEDCRMRRTEGEARDMAGQKGIGIMVSLQHRGAVGDGDDIETARRGS